MPLKITHTPGEWDGTMEIVTKALILDLLSDGKPFVATIVCMDDTYTGTVLEITSRTQEVTMDLAGKMETVYLPLMHIESIEVA